MFKVLWLLRRKPGISFEQFREHYENTHSVLGKIFRDDELNFLDSPETRAVLSDCHNTGTGS